MSMYKLLSELFAQSERLIKLTNDALVVYLVLRTDVELGETDTAKLLKGRGELTSGLSVQSIALKSRLSALTVQRVLNDLERLEWIKICKVAEDTRYNIGLIHEFECVWHVDAWLAVGKPSVEPDLSTTASVSDMIRGLLKEREAKREAIVGPPVRLSEEGKRRLLHDTIGEVSTGNSTKVLKHFEGVYKAKFKDTPLGFYSATLHRIDPKMYAYAKRVLEWCAGDVDNVCGLISWAFDNWEHLSSVCGLTGKPTFGILSTKGFFEKFMRYREFGLPLEGRVKDKDGVATRADTAKIADAPDVGWS